MSAPFPDAHAPGGLESEPWLSAHQAATAEAQPQHHRSGTPGSKGSHPPRPGGPTVETRTAWTGIAVPALHGWDAAFVPKTPTVPE